MRLIYTSLFFISLPFIILRLIWRGIRAPAYWQRWSERFGGSPDLSGQTATIWIHAVSVGEVEACRPLVKTLNIEFPDHQLLITTMTPTGSERVKLLFADSVAHCYLPYDLPFAIKRFLNKTQPQFGIIMETEIWPNLLSTCDKRNIPLVLSLYQVRQPRIPLLSSIITPLVFQSRITRSNSGRPGKNHCPGHIC